MDVWCASRWNAGMVRKEGSYGGCTMLARNGTIPCAFLGGGKVRRSELGPLRSIGVQSVRSWVQTGLAEAHTVTASAPEWPWVRACVRPGVLTDLTRNYIAQNTPPRCHHCHPPLPARPSPPWHCW